MMEKSKKILDRIKEEGIQPIPRWRFTLRNSLTWLVFGLSALIGAMAFSVILFAIQQTDFKLISHLSHSSRELLLGLLPFFWLTTLLVFLIAAMLSMKKMKKGYKYGWRRLAGFNTAISIVLGTLFFISSGAQWLEKSFQEQVPVYESLQEKKMKVWMQPEAGLVAGEIEELNGDSLFLRDFHGHRWSVFYGGAWVAPPVVFESGEKIKLRGRMEDDSKFVAVDIRPWGGGNRKIHTERQP